jgi:hypothetical protein
VVFSVEVNVVRVKKLWPRALLGPFTTSVPLTPADIRAYSDATASTAIKGYQGVDVTFEHPRAAPPVEVKVVEVPVEVEPVDGDAVAVQHPDPDPRPGG